MRLILQIQSGSRAGQKVEFSKPVVFAGRHPDADLRFDVNTDLDVSSRHAELRGTDAAWIVLDLGSTNGTWVNGERITAAKAIRAGDTIRFGANGPRAEVLSTGTPDDLNPTPRTDPDRKSTQEQVAIAVEAQTGHYKKFVVAFSVLVVVGVAAIVWLNKREVNASHQTIEAVLRQSDSLRNELQRRVDDANARAAGFDSLARALRTQRDRLTKALQAGGDVAQLTNEIGLLDRRTNQAISLTNRQIHDTNGKAVAYIVVEARNKMTFGGTAFVVAAGGLLVTNKHVLMEEGQPPNQIAVFLADSDTPLRAHFVSAAPDADIGFIQLDKAGTYPTVRGIASSASVGVGDPVIVTGFPGETDPAVGVAKRTTTTYGSVSKIDTLIQINAYAAQGSSGSPVFDSRGYVIGVLAGGEGGTSSVLTWFVPSTLLIAALPPEARGIIRQ